MNGDSDYHEEPTLAYFQTGRQDELLPNLPNNNWTSITKTELINVFTDLAEVKLNLNDPKFNHVDEISQADIIFVRKHFKDYKYLMKILLYKHIIMFYLIIFNLKEFVRKLSELFG